MWVSVVYVEIVQEMCAIVYMNWNLFFSPLSLTQGFFSPTSFLFLAIESAFFEIFILRYEYIRKKLPSSICIFNPLYLEPPAETFVVNLASQDGTLERRWRGGWNKLLPDCVVGKPEWEQSRWLSCGTFLMSSIINVSKTGHISLSSLNTTQHNPPFRSPLFHCYSPSVFWKVKIGWGSAQPASVLLGQTHLSFQEVLRGIIVSRKRRVTVRRSIQLGSIVTYRVWKALTNRVNLLPSWPTHTLWA